MTTRNRYDGNLQMFVEKAGDPDVEQLRFLRWLAERGYLEHEIAGESSGDLALARIAGAGDRFFPADFQRRVAGERLGIEADVLPGGHLIALSQPAALAAYLLST